MKSTVSDVQRDANIRANELLAYQHFGLSPAEKIISVNSKYAVTNVRLMIFGEQDDRPPILLLHGISSVSVIAASLIKHLQDRYVVAVDWPGHGLSDEFVLPLGGSVREHAVRVIESILDTLEMPEVDIVGHSLGAQFGIYTCLDRAVGPRIRRLVTLGAPGAGFLGVRPISIMKALAVPRLGPWLLSLPMSDKAFRRNNEKALGHGALRDLPDELLTAAKAFGERPGFAVSIASFFRSLIRRGSVRKGVTVPLEELEALVQPTMLVWGDEDVFMPTSAASASITAMRDVHLVRVPSAGHAPWLQQPDRVGEAVSAHLS